MSAGGAIDIVCNLFTEQEVRLGQTGIDETFMTQLRFSEDIRYGVSIENIWKRWIGLAFSARS